MFPCSGDTHCNASNSVVFLLSNALINVSKTFELPKTQVKSGMFIGQMVFSAVVYFYQCCSLEVFLVSTIYKSDLLLLHPFAKRF